MNDSSVIIRPYREDDLESIYEICLLTGNSGKDASKIYKDPKLLGHFYAAPYAVLEPELAFIVEVEGKQSGYILGTKNSENFKRKTEEKWFPELRKKYELPNPKDYSPDARIIRLIHQGYIFKSELKNYPAHLHIDLLPITQGKGIGRKLMKTFLNRLKDLNISAVHLEVGKKNTNAIGFYKKLGFVRLFEDQYSIAYGMKLLKNN